ncbi:hypothetical protein KL927_000108 [Ogataea polymorpha]|nr:hypothetical protein KL927_000108 [Ogataea polymorpha]
MPSSPGVAHSTALSMVATVSFPSLRENCPGCADSSRVVAGCKFGRYTRLRMGWFSLEMAWTLAKSGPSVFCRQRWQQRRVHVETRVFERLEEEGRDEKSKRHSHADVELAAQPVKVGTLICTHKRQTCLVGVAHDERFLVLFEPAATQLGRPCNHGDRVGVFGKKVRQAPDRKLVRAKVCDFEHKFSAVNIFIY